jgi:hypothetical protein
MTVEPIGPNTAIEKIVRDHPELVSCLMEMGIVCIACGEPVWGTLAENATKAGLEDISAIVDKLNSVLDQ